MHTRIRMNMSNMYKRNMYINTSRPYADIHTYIYIYIYIFSYKQYEYIWVTSCSFLGTVCALSQYVHTHTKCRRTYTQGMHLYRSLLRTVLERGAFERGACRQLRAWYICVHIRTFAYTSAHMHTHTNTHMYTCTRTFTRTCTRTCNGTCTYTRTRTCTRTCTCTCTCTHIGMETIIVAICVNVLCVLCVFV